MDQNYYRHCKKVMGKISLKGNLESHNKDWLKLDNAAQIYPSSSNNRSPAQFRLSVTFNSPIKFEALQQAWENVLHRCSYFQVYLRRGFFWYYLQKHHDTPVIELMEPLPNSIFRHKQRTASLIRISIRGNTLALDISHIITDGNGGMRFLFALIFEYFKLSGISFKKIPGILYTDEHQDPREFEDDYRKFFPGNITKPEKLSTAFHLAGKPFSNNNYRMISGMVPLKKIKQLLLQYQVSLTELLASIYLFALKEIYLQERNKKRLRSPIIRLEIPVNMRNFYPSLTMRNFSLFVSIEIDMKLGDYSFQELLRSVHLQMQIQINHKELSKQVSRNVGGELNPFVRIIPLYFKDLYLAGTYSRLGEKCYSGVLSNLGSIAVPEKAREYINAFDVILLPNHVMKKGCTVFSYGNNLSVNFSSITESRELERLFFTKLVADGIPVTIREV
jgi:NRPS condensation-like uncharacterized protein